MFDIILTCFYALFSLVLTVCYFYKIFKNYQLHMYYLSDTIKSLSFDMLETFLIEIIIFFNFLFIFLDNKNFIYVSLFIFFVLALTFCFKFKEKKQKNKLVFTKRFIRFFVLFFILNVGLLTILTIFLYKTRYFGLIFINFLFYSFLMFIFSHFLILPFENFIKNYYIKKAREKLKKCKNLKVICITGSYGKTSVKNFIYDILKTKYKVCVSPNSYNTQMGITKVILNNLNLNDEFLVLEMGADRLHDINNLCKIVKPDFSVITGVTNQHLKTFKTFENIVKTKFELIENTKDKGMVILNAENKITNDFYKQTNKEKYLVGKESNFCAQNIKCTLFGTKFNLVNDKEKMLISTKLLGKHNVLNLLLSSKLATLLGFSLEEIKIAIENIEQVNHRLNLIKSNGRFILDDSFNANCEGVKHAIEVLKTHCGKKIVITAGIVELGKDAYKENYKLGKLLKDIDYVIITNYVNRNAILDGLKKSKNVFLVENLNEAMIKLKDIFFEGDCVLFLNDLPDTYK